MNMETRNPQSELERDLETIRDSWPALDSTEPPDLLDRAVLNSARRSLGDLRRKRWRWVGAFATSTVVVLTLTIVMEQKHQGSIPGNGIRLDATAAGKADQKGVAGVTGTAEPAARSVPEGLDTDGRGRSLNRAASPTKAESDDPASPGAAGQQQAEMLDAAGLPNLEEALPGETAEPEPEPDPEAWIERLLRLSRSGSHEALARELEEFKIAFPDYPLPAELGG